MSFVGVLTSLVRDFVTDKFDDAFLERVSEIKWLSLPIGALAGLAVVIGIHVVSYNKFEDQENREQIIRRLEHAGYWAPTVQHLWVGGFCFQAGHPYQWQAGRVHGTACIGDWRGLTIHGGSRWWPFGKPEAPAKQ